MGDWKVWLHGLVAAAISSAASGITAAIVDPSAFNFTKSGLVKIGTLCGVNALIAVAAYLKQSPLPKAP
jgi:hypothetical protein